MRAMEYRLLGRTGLKVSTLSLGTMTFGGKGFWEVVGKSGPDVVRAVLRRSLDAGINLIDTANVYSEGESERLLGDALRDLGVPRHSVVLATKVLGRMGPGPNEVGLSRSHILHQIDESLKRLRTDHVDLYQIHGWDPITPVPEVLRTMDDLVRSGRVRHIGVSNWAAWQIARAIGHSEARGYARFESVQAYYTLAGRDLEREIAPLLRAEGLSLLVWSPLAGGLLSGKFTRDASPEGTRRAQFDFPPVDRDRAFAVVDVARAIAAERGVTVPQVALAWLLHQPHTTSVILGAKTPEQLEDNLGAADLKLSAEEIRRLDAVSALPREYPGWMIERQSANRS